MKLVFYSSLYVTVELLNNVVSQNVGSQSLAAGVLFFFKWVCFYFLDLRWKIPRVHVEFGLHRIHLWTLLVS